jgi:hypothetical protein
MTDKDIKNKGYLDRNESFQTEMKGDKQLEVGIPYSQSGIPQPGKCKRLLAADWRLERRPQATSYRGFGGQGKNIR